MGEVGHDFFCDLYPTTEYTYDPFGATTSTGATSTNPYQYTGRENDGTGLQYNRARYDNPTTTQFTSQDPLGLECIRLAAIEVNMTLPDWFDRTMRGRIVSIFRRNGVNAPLYLAREIDPTEV